MDPVEKVLKELFKETKNMSLEEFNELYSKTIIDDSSNIIIDYHKVISQLAEERDFLFFVLKFIVNLHIDRYNESDKQIIIRSEYKHKLQLAKRSYLEQNNESNDNMQSFDKLINDILKGK